MDDPHVFSCHPTLKETIWHSEVGASAAILAAGCEHVAAKLSGLAYYIFHHTLCTCVDAVPDDTAYLHEK